jgi:L-threonylcarbamoyladenylate synthase
MRTFGVVNERNRTRKPRQDSYKTFYCAGDNSIINNNAELTELIGIIQNGGVVVFPTDTVYGIGCDPYNDQAVSRIFAIKGREEKKSLPVLTDCLYNAENIVNLSGAAKSLAARYWPGALTIIAELKDKKISSLVTAGKQSLAIRVPANKCLLSLLKSARYLIGTSANKSGKSSVRDSRSIEQVAGISGFDALLDGGQVTGVESTIVDCTGKMPKVLREGAIPPSELMDYYLRNST